MKKLFLIPLLVVAVAIQAADQEQYIVGGGLDHPVQHWEFPDIATMNATTGFFSQDVGKLAFVTPGSYYYLGNPTPFWTWMGGYPLSWGGTYFSVGAPIIANAYRTASVGAGLNGQLLQTDGTTGADFSTDAARDSELKMARAMGSTTVAWPFIGSPAFMTQKFALTDGAAYYLAVWVPVAITVNGVKWYQDTQGVYTADNNNVVGLYSYSAGTMTQVAVSTNDGNIWKAAAGTWTSKNFSSSYSAQPGLYFIGFLYNSSAQTTAPFIGGVTAVLGNVPTMDFTNSAKFSGVVLTQTNLPASQAMSGVLTESNVKWLALY